jgi:hypothetical protein
MAKIKSKSQKQVLRQKSTKPVDENILPKKYETWICIGIIILSLLVFYNEIIFKGKVVMASDTINAGAGNVTGTSNEFPLWTPYVFSGMPSYGSLMTTGDRWFDLSKRIWDYIQMIFGQFILGEGWLIFYYFVFGLAMFLFMLNRGHNKLISAFTAIALIFSTTISGWLLVGHNTKLLAIVFFPFALLLVDKIIQKMNWFYAMVLIVVLHLIFESTHLQMVLYIYIFLGIYLAYSFLRSIKNKEKLIGLTRSIAVLIVTSGIAFALSADRYLSVWEYSKYSIRGTSPLIMDSKVRSTTGEGGGLSYDYATNWSFSPGEVMTFFIPGFYGSGTYNYKGILTNNQQAKINTYFGPMMSVDAPQYMGILVLVLALIGFYYHRKDIFVQVLFIISIFSLFLSFGRELPVLYNLMFYHFPFFDKFRVPVMVLILLQVSIAIMAGYGLTSIIDIYKNNTEKTKKKFLYVTLISIGILLICLAGKSVINDIYRGIFDGAVKSNTDNGFIQQLMFYKSKYPGEFSNINNLYYETIFSNMMNDLYFSIIVVGVFFAITYLLLKRIINLKIFYLAILIILVVDLWRIDYRPFQSSTKKEKTDLFTKPEFTEFLEKDKSLYRVLELDNNGPNTSNMLGNWNLQSIYGYSAAKLRIYQDVNEICHNPVNPFLWNLLNMKYLISKNVYADSILHLVYAGQEKESYKIMENRYCLPRAFFVNRYEVKDKLSIVYGLRDGTFNPGDVAYFESDPGIKVDPVDQTATVKVTNFNNHYITMEASASGNNLLFVSEIYYPAGWKAFIDGVETPIYKTNYIFRSVIVPKGNHKIEMKFEPEILLCI